MPSDPEYLFLAAAKEGGIHANNEYPAEFIRDNLAIQANIIHAAYVNQVKRLLFLGSSYIYPKLAPQSIPGNSHVILALIRKFHEAKVRGDKTVTVWGTGTPWREFLYSDDMADACVFLMNLPDDRYAAVLGSDESKIGRFEPPLINVGGGVDVTIRELMDSGRLLAQGWLPQIGLAEGLARSYRDFLGQG